MFSECRIKVLGIVFQCSATHFINDTRISNIYLYCVSASFCTGCVVLRQFLSFLFLAQVQKVSNEMTLVANESIIMHYVLSLVVDGSSLKLMQFKMVSSRHIFLQSVLHGICCKSSSP